MPFGFVFNKWEQYEKIIFYLISNIYPKKNFKIYYYIAYYIFSELIVGKLLNRAYKSVPKHFRYSRKKLIKENNDVSFNRVLL